MPHLMQGRFIGGLLFVAAVILLGGPSGCSTVQPMAGSTEPVRIAPLYAASALSDSDRVVAEEATRKDEGADAYYDPFAKPGEGAVGEEYDPWEPFNVVMFEFNRQLDRYVLKPVARGYNFVVPDPVQIGVSNFFFHIRFPTRFLNNVFQGKFKGAGIEVERFLINSTFGLAGFVDVAKVGFDLQTPDEDTGQTLGFYGVKPGPYLVLPFLPPLNLRDGFGYVADIALNPINWLVFPIVEVEGIPSLVAHKNRTTTTIVQISGRAYEIINDRSLNLEKFQGVEEATLDLYTAVRNAYLQKRARAIGE